MGHVIHLRVPLSLSLHDVFLISSIGREPSHLLLLLLLFHKQQLVTYKLYRDMAKLGKLNNKLKSAIKRWPSFTKLSRPLHSPTVTMANSHDDNDDDNHDHHDKVITKEVYVGKSRRRYLLASHVVRHPLFQELIDRSSSSGGGSCGSGGDGDDDHGQVAVLACEVVLFEHLLWMLESDAAGGSSQFHGGSGSTHELADFYCTS